MKFQEIGTEKIILSEDIQTQIDKHVFSLICKLSLEFFNWYV